MTGGRPGKQPPPETSMRNPRRGEVWFVDFDPSVGTEIRKVRPALIISNDVANRVRTKVTLMPITGTLAESPVAVQLEPNPTNGLDRPSLVKVLDLTTFDKSRLRRRVGEIHASELRLVEERLREYLGL